MNVECEKILIKRKNKVIYREDNTVVKLFDENYSKSDVLNEALNQSRVENIGLYVPQILEIMKINNCWAIRSEFIQGQTLEELMNKNNAKRAEYLDLFVNLQMQIHKKQAMLLTKLKDKMRRKISGTSLDSTTKYELFTRIEGMPRHKKVCHGDFNPSNIIITPQKEAYILDWAHATQGNASADVAQTYFLFYINGETKLANEYLNLFCKKSGTSKQYVQNWFSIVAASQLLKSNPEKNQFLFKWINVADYQ